MSDYNFPAALAHSAITELFPDVFFVTGSVNMPGRMPMKISRNMTILREDGQLTLVNSVRLMDASLAELERLGTVKHIVRLAGFHGMDDPFYKERYGAKLYSVDAPYVAGFDQEGTPYASADVVLGSDVALPLRDVRFIGITSATPDEGLLHVAREGGVLISGDCLQNWGRTDAYFNLPARVMMKLLGFIKPHNIGPGWLRFAKPDVAEVKGLLDLDFDHVLPAHGAPVIGNAKHLFGPAIQKL